VYRAVAAIVGMASILCAAYFLVPGGAGLEQCHARPDAGCLLDLADEISATIPDETSRSDVIGDIAVARARAADFQAALAEAGKLQSGSLRREALLAIAEEQAKAGKQDAAAVTVDGVLGAIDGGDAELEGKAAIAFAAIGDAPRALEIIGQISDEVARKNALASVYFALAERGQIEFTDYLTKLDFGGDRQELEAFATRLIELVEKLARAGQPRTARLVLKATRETVSPILNPNLANALAGATISVYAEMGYYDAAISLANSRPNPQFRAKQIFEVAKATSRSGQTTMPVGVIDDLVTDARDVSPTERRETLLAYVMATYVVAGYPERASSLASEISEGLMRGAAYGAAARGLLDVGNVEGSGPYLDLAVNELTGLRRGASEDLVVRGVADQLARSGRAEQALGLMLTVSDTTTGIASAYITLANELSRNTNALSVGEQSPEFAPTSEAPAAAADPVAQDQGEANRLFVEAVQLYRAAASQPEGERVALYRHALVNIDRIVAEFGNTDIARRIESGAPLGPIDLDQLRLLVGVIATGNG